MIEMLTTAPRGTSDILPSVTANWQQIESLIRDICLRYNYKEIRTPIFEHTELFLRGIGNTTDIVSKEMYTFEDRGGRSITLRPENTASVVRAYLENKLYADNYLNKLFYIGPMFRYDRPQAGRFRQFHQFGIEAIGSENPLIDAEVIALAVNLLQELGLTDLNVLINSVGCPKCRPVYKEKLQAFFQENLGELCKDCQSRYEQNPLRILDCKIDKCKQLSVGVPTLKECLCEECTTQFGKLQNYLAALGIKYKLDNNLVRGLDYYTKTAFEIQYLPLGAQSAVCGGGRYDGLISECGGNPTPAIGFAMGIERILLALQKQNLIKELASTVDVYIVATGEEANQEAIKLAVKLRKYALSCEIDFANRSMKAQMKAANKLQAKHVIIIAEQELQEQTYSYKNMLTSEQVSIKNQDLNMLLSKLGVDKEC